MIKALQLNQFRNYESATVELSEKVNIFLGKNGQGKTNLLEALHLILSGSSFRYVDNTTLIKKGAAGAVLRTKIKISDLDYLVQLEISKSRKAHSINGKKAPTSELQKKFKSVVFSPESLSAIKDGADQRRELLDDFIVTHKPQNADLLAEYRKALKTRNRVLKELSEGLIDKNSGLLVLQSLEPSFVRLANQVTQERIEGIKAILPSFQRAMREISNDQNVEILVEYVISGQNSVNYSFEQTENLIKNRMKELREAEISSGTSLVGPQKHDVIILYNQNDSRFFCSQGQQRALILSFKMAQIVYHQTLHGIYPVLMLDDVLSELDEQKRKSLIRFLNEINTQIFITTTDLTLPEGLKDKDCKVIEVSEGAIL